jgi:MSHA biogenesis protein MshJ
MRKLLNAFLKLKARERLGATIVLAVAVYFLLDVTLVTPLEKERKRLNADLAAKQLELNTATAEVTVVATKLASDPNAAARQQLAQLRATASEAARFLAQADEQPKQVGALLRQALAGAQGLTLVSLKTLPVTTIYEAKQNPQQAQSNATKLAESKGVLAPAAKSIPAPDPKKADAVVAMRSVYRHGIELTVKGNYLALLPYLEQLQSQRLLWGDAELSVTGYPDSTLRVTIYTLGRQPTSAFAG